MLCWWVSMLTGKRVHVISSNLTLKNDGSLRTKVQTGLYRVTVKSKRYTQLVTSLKYGKSAWRKNTARRFARIFNGECFANG